MTPPRRNRALPSREYSASSSLTHLGLTIPTTCSLIGPDVGIPDKFQMLFSKVGNQPGTQLKKVPFQMPARISEEKTHRCSGALLRVPVTGCRLCGSSANLARGHLAAKERCPPRARSNLNCSHGPRKPGNSASHLSTRKLHQICAVTLPAAL